MPKQSNKEVTKKRRTLCSTGKKKVIQKSKQLKAKLKNSLKTRKRSKVTKKDIFGVGVPMPSLEELEEYYNDSESDESTSETTPKNNKDNNDDTPYSSENNVENSFNNSVKPTFTSKSNQEKINSSKECQLTENIIISPISAAELASKLLDKLSQISDPSELLDHLPPPPVVPQKKPKNSGIPYIVGCKDRPQVIKKPKTNFCKGDDYGVHLNASISDEDDFSPCKRRCRFKRVNLSKSIFNAKSDEIAARLKALDKVVENDNNADNFNFMVISPQLPGLSKDNSNGFSPSYTSLQTEKKIKASYIVVDDDSEDNIEAENITVPKPFYYNDDCYIIEQSHKKNDLMMPMPRMPRN